MKFIIRDDDLNFFSKSADIKRWYGDIFADGIPVGFATIPFVKGTSDVYRLSNKNKEFPINENRELIDYVKSNPLIEIIQHGCTHETKNSVYEYARKSGLVEETKRGKEELERAFGIAPKVFAPPHDWISMHGIRAIEKTGLHIIRGRGAGLRNINFRPKYILNFLRMLVFRFPKYISPEPPVYPYVLDFGTHKEMCSYRLEDKDIFVGLKKTHNKNGIFVVVVHAHSMNEEKKKLLLSLIEKAREYKAEFVRPSAIFS